MAWLGIGMLFYSTLPGGGGQDKRDVGSLPPCTPLGPLFLLCAPSFLPPSPSTVLLPRNPLPFM